MREGKRFMKKQNKWIAWVLSILVIATYIIPSNMFNIYAATEEAFGSVSISKITQNQSTIQPGDTFSITVDVKASRLGDGENKVYISNAMVTGDGIDSSKTNFTVKEDAQVNGVDESKTVVISGIVYAGGGKDIEVIVEVGGSYQTTMPDSSDTKAFTLTAKTSDDFVDVLTVEKHDNLLVKTGQTQNVEVKLTNKGNFTDRKSVV